MTELTTSATKLYHILKKFKDYRKSNSTLIDIWAEITGIKDPEDNLEISNLEISGKLSELFLLCDEIKSEIRVIEKIEPKKIYINAIKRIELFLLNNNLLENYYEENEYGFLNINIKELQSQIHPDTLGLIEALGHLMQDQLALKEIDKDTLEELKQKIYALRDEIEESDIEADLKQFLKQELNKIEEAIDKYNIKGSSGLDKTIKEVLGNICFTVPTLWKGSKEGREKIMNLINFLVKINGYISLGERLEKISEFMQKFLPPTK